MRLRLDWFGGLHEALFGPAKLEARQKPLAIGIGYCPGCSGFRATASLGCEECGNTDRVTADA
jgi:hypothetical protein